MNDRRESEAARRPTSTYSTFSAVNWNLFKEKDVPIEYHPRTPIDGVRPRRNNKNVE